MIDFATLQELTIPEGVVTQITDASGRILWSAGGDTAVLQVEKIVANTYAAETTYNNEEFILLDIYPKTNGTVNVTYGGLTKTITDTTGEAEPNSQEVFFGTFNGVSDSVATPASGKLTIEGDFYAFGCSLYGISKVTSAICSCIISVSSFGVSDRIPDYAFGSLTTGGCTKLEKVNITRNVKSLGKSAFHGCTGLKNIMIPSSVTSIGTACFTYCSSLANFIVSSENESYFSDGPTLFNKVKTDLIAYPSAKGVYTVPSGVINILDSAFQGAVGLTSVTIPSTVKEICYSSFYGCKGLTSVTIQEGVESIGSMAFLFTDALKNITLPASIKNIDVSAFDIGQEYEYTRTITMLSTTPPTMSSAMAGCYIVVPAGCGATYKAAEGWSKYADYITEAS